MKLPIKIGIIEDKPEYRQAFKDYCEKSERLDCQLATESAEQFIKYASVKLPLDLILLDINLPGISGIDAIRFIRRIYPEVEIIMLTAFQDHENVFQSIQNGANGYLLKKLPLAELEKEIIAVIDEQAVAMSPQVARRLLQFFQPKSAILQIYKRKQKLTPTEAQIIKYTLQGLSYEEVGNMLGITINGVRFHIKNIYKKLQIKSKSSLLKMYLDGFFDSIFKL